MKIKEALIISSDDINNKTFDSFRNIVLVGGCFDILHYGHLQFLKASKELGNSLVLLLEPDEFILKRKQRNPYHIQKERAEMLSSMCYVDSVINLSHIFSDSDYAEIIKKIRPSIICITQGDPMEVKKREHAQSVGSRLLVFQQFPFSSSHILTYASISRD